MDSRARLEREPARTLLTNRLCNVGGYPIASLILVAVPHGPRHGGQPAENHARGVDIDTGFLRQARGGGDLRPGPARGYRRLQLALQLDVPPRGGGHGVDTRPGESRGRRCHRRDGDSAETPTRTGRVVSVNPPGRHRRLVERRGARVHEAPVRAASLTRAARCEHTGRRRVQSRAGPPGQVLEIIRLLRDSLRIHRGHVERKVPRCHSTVRAALGVSVKSLGTPIGTLTHSCVPRSSHAVHRPFGLERREQLIVVERQRHGGAGRLEGRAEPEAVPAAADGAGWDGERGVVTRGRRGFPLAILGFQRRVHSRRSGSQHLRRRQPRILLCILGEGVEVWELRLYSHPARRLLGILVNPSRVAVRICIRVRRVRGA